MQCGDLAEPKRLGRTHFRKTGARMTIKRAVPAMALFCTATMLTAHAMAPSPTSSDRLEKIPSGLRRMVQTLQKCNIIITDSADPNFSCFVDGPI